MKFRNLYIIYFIISTSSLFSQNQRLQPSKQIEGNNIDWVQELQMHSKSLSLEEVEHLLKVQEKLKESYFNTIGEHFESKKLRGLAQAQAAQREKNLKGGMMLLSGIISTAVGGLSFYFSEQYYHKYIAAEITEDSIKYRKATQSLDALKFILLGAGIGITAGSAYYFIQSPTAQEVAQMRSYQERLKEWFYVR